MIAASLATYGFKRRLVYRGYVSKELWPRRGITAGSPFATGDLWLVCSDLMHQIFELFPKVVFGVHVDDTQGEQQEEVVEMLRLVHERVQEGMRDQAELMVSHPKTAALASTQGLADKIAIAIGFPAGVVVCKKFGVDYRLFGSGQGTTTPVVGGESRGESLHATRPRGAKKRAPCTKKRESRQWRLSPARK